MTHTNGATTDPVILALQREIDDLRRLIDPLRDKPDPPPFTRNQLAREAWKAYQEYNRVTADILRPPGMSPGMRDDFKGEVNRILKGQEAWSWDTPWLDPQELYYDQMGTDRNFWPLLQRPTPLLYQLSMKRGDYLPIYNSEEILRIIRENNRFVSNTSEYAQAGFENRVNYLVGDGFKYEAEPKPEYVGKVDKGDLQQIQRMVDLICEYNAIDQMEAESMLRYDMEGEWTIRIFWNKDIPTLRFVEPDLIRSPTGDIDPADSFGIATDRYDVEDVRGAWIVDDPITQGYQPTFVPETDFVRCRNSMFGSAKRGLPLYYTCENALVQTSKMMRSVSALAIARSKIAMIRRLDGIAPASAQSLVQSVTATGIAQANASGGPPPSERYYDATILNADKRTDYEFPDNHLNPDAIITTAYSRLKGVSARCVIPSEWLTGDQSEMAAYNATIVAESKIGKSFSRLAKKFTGAFGSNRIGTRRSVLMRCLKWFADRGYINAEVLPMIQIKTTPNSIVTRNKRDEASTNDELNKMGAKSIQTIQEEAGLDPEVETQRILEERKKGIGAPGPQQPPQPAGDAIPGEPGTDTEQQQQEAIQRGLEIHGAPPWPGAVFDESNHRWRVPHDKGIDSKPNWSDEEKQAITDYGNSGFIGINNALRRGDKLSKSGKKFVTNIDSAIEKSQPIEHTTIVYRGVTGDSLDHLSEGDAFREPGFLSTSSNPETAKLFKPKGDVGKILVIQVPKGTKCLDVEQTRGDSEQAELLFPRRTLLKIVKVKGNVLYAKIVPRANRGQEAIRAEIQWAQEAGFTGTITDKAGRKRTYQDGKQVKGQQEEPVAKTKAGTKEETPNPAKAEPTTEPRKEEPKPAVDWIEKRSVTLGGQKRGNSKASVHVSDPRIEKKTEELLGQIFPGHSAQQAHEALASSLGAPDNATIHITEAGKYTKLYSDDIPPTKGCQGMRVVIEHPDLSRCVRFVGVDANGKKFIRNEIIVARPGKEGIGAKIFSVQVQHAAEQGFDYIHTHAAGDAYDGNLNGYYTWPRYGYDMSLTDKTKMPRAARELMNKVRKLAPDAKTVLDVMSLPDMKLSGSDLTEARQKWNHVKRSIARKKGLPEPPVEDKTHFTGTEWWQAVGRDMINARFDLSEGSRSLAILDKYLSDKGTKPSA